MLQNELQKLGLTESESKVYLAALELGETNISRLAKKSGVKRTTTYLIVETLKDKGLVSSIKKKNKIVFFAENPRTLEGLLEEKKETLGRIMPQLLSFTNLIDNKPQIRYFEGAGGIKEIFKDSLRYPGQELCIWYSESFMKEFDSFFKDYYIPKRKEKKIFVRGILPDNVAIREYIQGDTSQLRKSKLFPESLYHINIEVIIYGRDQVGIASYDEHFALIIQSPAIHKSLKSIFETMWALGV